MVMVEENHVCKLVCQCKSCSNNRLYVECIITCSTCIDDTLHCELTKDVTFDISSIISFFPVLFCMNNKRDHLLITRNVKF